jgi:hypothetical protein
VRRRASRTSHSAQARNYVKWGAENSVKTGMFRGIPRCTVDRRGRWWPATPIDRDHRRYRADECRVQVGMDIDYFEPGARLIPALHDTPCAPTAVAGHGALRAEAIRQVRSQLREWQRVPAMHTTGSPCLVVASERAKLHDSLDLLQRAGEDVPPWLYRQGALVWSMNAASGITAGVSSPISRGCLPGLTRRRHRWVRPPTS